MFFAHNDRYQYAVSPLIEVICQLRFPTILSIGTREPADFQEAIRSEYPRYIVRQDQLPPKVIGGESGSPRVEQQAPVTNYNFLSQDGRWKINLTSGFVALSTVSYTQWEEFAQRLDKMLAQFIPLYHPAFFERIGLRYVNAFSRQRLGLEGTSWCDLIQPAYLGALAEPDIQESQVTRCSMDTELALNDGYKLKLHTGPGLLGDGKADPEPKFILDGDFSIAGNLPLDQVPESLLTMHDHSTRLLRGALTSQLHTAMGPTPL